MSKGGGSPKTPQYYVGMQLALCHGPIDKIIEVRVNNLIAWQGSTGDGTISINQPELFGGTSREGGIIGALGISLGKITQTANTYLASVIGSAIPAFRGICSIVLEHVYIGQNYYMKPWSFMCTRIHTRHYTGIAQWYDAYAEVPSSPVYSYIKNINADLIYIRHTGTNLATAYFTGDMTLTDVGGTLLAPGGLITISGATDNNYNGTFTTNSIGYTTSSISYTMNGNPLADAIGPIRIQSGGVTYHPAGLINAVHVLRECLTDPTWGMGYLDALIDNASWELAARTCWNEGLGFSWLWDEGKIEDFVGDICKHIQGNVYQNRTDGKFYINLIRQLTDTTGLLILNKSNTSAINDFHTTSIGTLVSKVTVKYVDNITNQDNTSIPMVNITLGARQSTPIEQVITYSGVASSDVAQKLAIRDLQQLSTPAYSCTINCNRDAENLNKGDAFLLDRPDYLNSIITMRVYSIELGTLTSGQITIEAVEDIFKAPNIIYTTPAATSWTSPVSDPIDAPYQLILETPYYSVALAKGDAYAKIVDTTTSFMVAAAAAPTPDSILAEIWTTTGSTYKPYGSLNFCSTATLASALDRYTTTVLLANIINPTYLPVGDFIQIGDELMGIVTISGGTLTVLRGVLDTIPEDHTVGSRMMGWDDYSGSDKQEYLLGETVHVKLLTTTARGVLPLASATVNNVTLYGRMHRPYPPANFQVNSGYWPTSISLTNLSLSWATRNRFQQTAGLTSYYASSITSETGVTYAWSLDTVGGVNLLSATAISGTSSTVNCYITNTSVPISITHSGILATFTTTSAHGLVTGTKVTISGASDSLYNGNFTITDLSATTFTYSMTGTPAANASGTFILKNSIYNGSVILTTWSINANGISKKVTVPFNLN